MLPLGVRYIADHLLEGGFSQVSRILQAGLILTILVVLQALCTYFFDYRGHVLGAQIERDMREQMFRHCQRLSFRYYDEHTVGDLMSRISNDSLSLSEFFHHVPEDLLVQGVKLIGASAILLTIHWQTALLLLAFLPFMAVYTLHFNRKMGDALKRSRESMGRINA